MKSIEGDISNQGHKNETGSVKGPRPRLLQGFAWPRFPTTPHLLWLGYPERLLRTRPLRLGSCDSSGRHRAAGAPELDSFKTQVPFGRLVTAFPT